MGTVMAVGAHTGDAQLTMGLYLAKAASKGHKIVTLDLTAGERGCPPHIPMDEFRQLNVESAAKFAKAFSGDSVVLDTPDGELNYSQELAVKIGDIMRSYKIDTVLCHWKNSMHKDHIVASHLTQDAVFFASLPTFARPLPPAPIKRWLYAENWEDSEGFTPYMYFDVSDVFEDWKAAVKQLYLTEHSRDFKYLQFYEGLARMRGALNKCEYATAFDIDGYMKRMRGEV